MSTAAGMAPYVIAMDRSSYSRWIPIYLANMNLLEELHPDVHRYTVNSRSGIIRLVLVRCELIWYLRNPLIWILKNPGGNVLGQQKGGSSRLTSHERVVITSATKKM